MAAGLDLEALSVALVLDPATYSRNRFFELYDDPSMRRVRRRAALLRGLIKQLATVLDRSSAMTLSSTARGDMEELRFEIPSLGLRRRTLLDATEGALLRFALDRRTRAEVVPGELALRKEDRERVHQALLRLSAPMGDARADLPHPCAGLPEADGHPAGPLR